MEQFLNPNPPKNRPKHFARAGVLPLTDQVRRRQLAFFGRIALLPAQDPRRKCVFVGDSLALELDHYVRKRGRPRQTWAKEMYNEAVGHFGRSRLHMLLEDRTSGAYQRWLQVVESIYKARRAHLSAA